MIRRLTIFSLLIASLSLILTGCGTMPIRLSDDYVIVKGDDISANLAVQEFNDIVQKSTGKKYRIGDANGSAKHIFIGRSPEVEKHLGKEMLDSLRNEESLVVGKGNDLFLVGGGDVGTLYAVYDFMEDNLGYRFYFNRKGGEKIDKKNVLTWSGVESRKKPAFPGYRKDFHNPRGYDLHRLRNRDNSVVDRFIKDYQYKYRGTIGGHGFLYFIPAEDPKPGQGYRPKAIRGYFKTNPEYFSMNEKGKRVPDAQLCLSNPETRKTLTKNFMAWVKERGPGMYMFGSNDNHNARYCWCPNCQKLEKKYDSVGGPLWDYILELCQYLKDNKVEGVYVKSLAYKGPNQTEKAPKGIVFPDNFICDAAFLNSDRTLHEVPDEILPDGTIFNRYENLKKWVSITPHVAYWYYGGSNPAEVYSRTGKEMREIRDAGVKSVGVCGFGGGYEFGDIARYVGFQMMRNPDADEREIAKEVIEFKYGPAADLMLQYIDELDAARVKQIKTIPHLLGCDSIYKNFSFLSGKELVRWQKLFDKALEKVAGQEPYEREVRFARIGLDIFSLIYAHKIKSECPDFEFDAAAIEKRARSTVKEMVKVGRIPAKRNQAIEELDTMANYANLKDDTLPAELQKYPKDKVYRFLPPKRGKYYCPHWTGKMTAEVDPQSCCGFAQVDDIPDKKDYSKGMGVEFYDSAERKWLIRPDQCTIPLSFFEKDKYKLFRIGTTRIPKSCGLIFGGLWGSPTGVNSLSSCFDPSYYARQYEIWASVKAQGPKFFKDDKRKNKLFVEQVFAVDKGMPTGK